MHRFTLEELGLVDAEPEPAFTHLAELASRLLDAPTSLVSFVQVERDRQFLKARVGTDTVQTPLSRSFCRHVVAADEPLVIADSLEDHRVWDNPAIEESGVRAYLGTPVHGPDGAPVASLCVIDARPRDWSEADRATLEGLARCVTDAIRLKHEICAGERLRREQRDFAHAISHDVKGPLQTIGWVLEDVEEHHGRDFNRDTAQLVDLAKETISRTRQMVDGLLELGSVEPGHGPERAPVELAGVLDEVRRMLDGDVRRLDARVHVPDDLPTVSGDRRQLTMLFRNLLGNALKFRRPGVPPRVRIAWRMADGAFELDVADNGVGIPAGQRERAFRLFERLDTSDDREGSGIGLSLVKRVIEGQGGEVRVDSDGRTGTTFTVRLPRKVGSVRGARSSAGSDARSSANPSAEPAPNAALVPNAVAVAVAKAA